MLKRAALLITLITAFSSTSFANSICPSALEIHQAVFKTQESPAFFLYTLKNSLVVVGIPITTENPKPTKAQADAILQSTTAPYPTNDTPCFYAPDASIASLSTLFVIWTPTQSQLLDMHRIYK